jgi:uncharacterized protein YdeI (YjbR/CyaY-like superfamily)
VKSPSPRPTFFATPDVFRRWLERHHRDRAELWVGFHKRSTGRASLTWPESVDVALCFGWIDGVRKSLGPETYVIRFTRRKARSTWSNVNVRRARALTRERLMQPAGLAAFEARATKRSGTYAYENRPKSLPPKYAKRMRANAKAWAFFSAQAPWYRRTATWWVVSAKREETRLRRLAFLIEHSARGRAIHQLDRKPKKPA